MESAWRGVRVTTRGAKRWLGIAKIDIDETDGDALIPYLQVKSVYYDTLIQDYIGNPEVQEIKNAVNANNNSANRDSYDIYIVVSLDTEHYSDLKFGEIQIRTAVSKTNIMVWKWGSEKRFFDYLNVLCEEISTKKNLKEYIGSEDPINALEKLWREYRDKQNDPTKTPNKTPNANTLRDRILQKNFERAKQIVLKKSENPIGGGVPLVTVAARAQLTAAMVAVRAYFAQDQVIDVNNPNNRNKILDEIVPKITAMAIEAGRIGASGGLTGAGALVAAGGQEVAIAVLLAYASPGADSLAGTSADCSAKSIMAAAHTVFDRNKTLGTGAVEDNNTRLIYIAGIDAGRVDRAGLLDAVCNAGRTTGALADAVVNAGTQYSKITPDQNAFAQTRFRAFYNGGNEIALVGAGAAAPIQLGANAARALIACAEVIYPHGSAVALGANGFTQAVVGNGVISEDLRIDIGANPYNAAAPLKNYDLNSPVNAAGAYRQIYEALFTLINGQMVDFTGLGTGNLALLETGDNFSAAPALPYNDVQHKYQMLKRISDARARIRKHIDDNIPIVIYGSAADYGRANIIMDRAASKYVASLMDLFLFRYEKEVLDNQKIRPRDYLIAFMWNGYDPSINRSISKSLKLMRLRPSNDVFGNTEESERIVYFGELRRLFVAFMNRNKQYLAGQGVFSMNYQNVGANRAELETKVGDAKEKTATGRSAIRKYFLNRFGNGKYLNNINYQEGGIDTVNGTNVPLAGGEIVATPGLAALTPIFYGDQATAPAVNHDDLNPFYRNQKEFLSDVSKLSKSERDIVSRVFEMGQKQQQPNPNLVTVPLKGHTIYARFADLCTLVYAFRHKNDDIVKTVIPPGVTGQPLPPTVQPTVPVPALPQIVLQPDGGLLYALRTAAAAAATKANAEKALEYRRKVLIYSLSETHGGATNIQRTFIGGKKKSSSSKSKSIKSKSSSSKPSKSTKSSKSSSTKSKSTKSSKSTKTKKSRK